MNIFLDKSRVEPTSTRRVIITPCQATENKTPATLIYNDDETGYFAIKLLMLLDKEELKERSGMFRAKSSSNIEFGDWIVIGEKPRHENFDYQVIDNLDYVRRLDSRKFRKVYSLVDDFENIVDRLVKKKANHNPVFQIKKLLQKPEETKIRVNITTKVNLSQVSDVHYSAQKVTIFENWVKVGYNQYTIVKTEGSWYITLNTGKRLYVAQDTLGRKVLVE